MTGPVHYLAAEVAGARARHGRGGRFARRGGDSRRVQRRRADLADAQVHALLALAAVLGLGADMGRPTSGLGASWPLPRRRRDGPRPRARCAASLARPHSRGRLALRPAPRPSAQGCPRTIGAGPRRPYDRRPGAGSYQLLQVILKIANGLDRQDFHPPSPPVSDLEMTLPRPSPGGDRAAFPAVSRARRQHHRVPGHILGRGGCDGRPLREEPAARAVQGRAERRHGAAAVADREELTGLTRRARGG
jgi:hypothetical protein